MRCACLLLVLCMGPAGANADYMFQFDLSTYASGLTGTTESQDLFLVANNGDTLASAGAVEFNFDAVPGAGNTKIVGFTADAAFVPGSAFNSTTVSSTATGIKARLYANAAPATANRLRLGSVTMQLGSSGNSTTLTLSDPGGDGASAAGNNVNVTAIGIPPSPPLTFNVDSRVFPATFTANVAAVPEPSSAALVSLGVLGLALRRRREAASA